MKSVAHYEYKHAEQPHWNRYLVPPIMRLAGEIRPGMRVLDIGCGNGYIASLFLGHGCRVVGVDPSESGIRHARSAYPEARFEIDIATPDLRERLGEEPFDLVISAEVAEHVYDADAWAQSASNALQPGGRFVVTTPYHGYIKNIVIAASGRWDHHHTSLRTGEHIKFWSRRTMAALLERNGFRVAGFLGAGRAAYLWKSMVMAAERMGD